MSAEQDVVVLGTGMHPWGKWGRNFAEYGVVAARAALQDARVAWSDIDYLAAGNTMRNGYPGYVAGSTFAQALGWQGIPVSSSFAACASGAVALEAARVRILSGKADVALVVGADTAPKGFLARCRVNAPKTLTGCASICLVRLIRPTSLCTPAGVWNSTDPPRKISPR